MKVRARGRGVRNRTRAGADATRGIAMGLILAVVAVGWTQLLLEGDHGHHHGGPSPLLHLARDAGLAVPLVIAAVLLGQQLASARRGATGTPAAERAREAVMVPACVTAALVAAAPLHGLLFEASAEPLARHLATLAVSLLPVTVVTTVAFAAWWPSGRRPRLPIIGLQPAAVLGITAALAAGVVVMEPPRPAAANGDGVCPAGARTLHYDVAAFETVIPLNGWGDHVPNGVMYALRGDDARIGKAQIVANPNLTQPLVIRANVGDCIKVSLRNDIRSSRYPRVGLHADPIVQSDPKTSDGARVGHNPDTTVATGQTIEYTWYADREGQGALTDPANLDLGHLNTSSMSFGLYGAIVVHPKGSVWRNPITGADLLSGSRAVEAQLFADIITAPDAGQSHRSFAMLVGDEVQGVRDRAGHEPTFPSTGLDDSTFGINYRSEPMRNRLRAVMEHRGNRRFDPELQQWVEGSPENITLPNGTLITPTDHFCDGWVPELNGIVEDPGAKCMGEEMALQSWIFGDEGKLTRRLADGSIVVDTDSMIPKAYVGDAVRFHVVHPGTKETHPWHQHTHRWNQDPHNPDSPLKDVQAIAPGGSFEARLDGGAGGRQRTAGDVIFHCHLYPHFAQGFWGHLRVFDVLRNGEPLSAGGQLTPLPDGNPGNEYADGTPIEKLNALPTTTVPAPSAEKPGFPLFVKGVVGQRAYRPPHAVVKDTFVDKATTNGLPYRRPGDTVRTLEGLEGSGLVALAAQPANARIPGTGVIDPCPAGVPLRTYRPHAMDVPLKYNSAGWGTPEGRVFVEESHVAAVKAGTRQPEPYTIRARLGECVQLLTTNDFHLDDDPNVAIDYLGKYDGVYQHKAPTSEVSNHVHLVHFDQLGSDGTSVGWNYVQAAMPGQTYGYRWYADVALRTVFFHDHQYANLHQQRGLYAALNVEPADATWHDPRTGNQTDGVGTQADIRSASGADFREFTIFHEDRVPLWRDFDASNPYQRFAKPVVPPGHPDDFGEDQGGQGFNYRNEPFQIRVKPDASTAQKREPAYVYSSAVHGDPATPIFRSYSGDPSVIRNVPASHEEMHTFNVHGHRWLNQPDNPLSDPVDTQSVSLAEWFNYDVSGGSVRLIRRNRQQTLQHAANDTANGTPMIMTAGAGGSGGAGLPGDYLYASTALDDQWHGLWGLFRVHAGKASDLVPLPDRPAPGKTSPWPALKPGDALKPVPTQSGVQVCANGDPLRSYQIVAMQLPIVYNDRTGDHDPYGLIYALASDESALRAGTKKPEPLVLRANAGECLQVSVTNKLTAPLPVHSGDVPLEPGAPWPRPSSPRISMHPGMVDLDPTRSDGTAAGYNYDQTVAPGKSIVYTWWVPSALSGVSANLVDFGDRVANRHHGLWGALAIEPKGSTWHHPETGAPIVTGDRAVIRWTDAAGKAHARREFVVNVQDGLRLLDGSGQLIQPAADVDDPYELGARGINYRAERFAPRLANAGVSDVFSSTVHGDPATPVFDAFVGDPLWLRVLQGGDRGRAHSFLLHGHEWFSQRLDPNSTRTSVQDGLMPGRAFTFELGPTGGAPHPDGGAGGRQRRAGDYLFRDGNLMNQVNQGLWGLLRVHETGSTQTRTLPL